MVVTRTGELLSRRTHERRSEAAPCAPLGARSESAARLSFPALVAPLRRRCLGWPPVEKGDFVYPLRLLCRPLGYLAFVLALFALFAAPRIPAHRRWHGRARGSRRSGVVVALAHWGFTLANTPRKPCCRRAGRGVWSVGRRRSPVAAARAAALNSIAADLGTGGCSPVRGAQAGPRNRARGTTEMSFELVLELSP